MKISTSLERRGLKITIMKGALKIINLVQGKTPKQRYQKWLKLNTPSAEELEKQRHTKFRKMPKISLLVPMYNTDEKFFYELVECLKAQTYENWELCLADGSPEKHEAYLGAIASDKRIKYIYRKEAGLPSDAVMKTFRLARKDFEGTGISSNTNAALALATGDYIGLIDHDDLVPPSALFEFVKAINENPEAGIFYSDEDKIDAKTYKHFLPHFKPEFSKYALINSNYITHFTMFSRDLLRKIGGFRSEFDGSQDFDIILRASSVADKIVHIPKILYHWRVHETSTANDAEAKPYAFIAGCKASNAYLQANHIKATAHITDKVPGIYDAQFEITGRSKVSVFFTQSPNNLEEKKEEILTSSSYKNIVFNDRDADFYLLMNPLLSSRHKDWIERLLGVAQQKDVGAVGAKIYAKSGRVLSAGAVFDGKTGKCSPKFTLEHVNLFSYFGKLTSMQEVSVIPGDLLMVEAGLFNKHIVNSLENCRMEEIYEITAKFCLELMREGLVNIYNPYVEMKAERPIKYRAVVKNAEISQDPYYSPNFEQTNGDCKIRIK